MIPFGIAVHPEAPARSERDVPRIRELGLVIPDPELRFDEDAGEWRYTEPDWNELRTVVTNHGPMSEARLEFRRLARAETAWVRDTILGVPAAAA